MTGSRDLQEARKRESSIGLAFDFNLMQSINTSSVWKRRDFSLHGDRENEEQCLFTSATYVSKSIIVE